MNKPTSICVFGDSDDGLHPNAQGHEKVFARVRDFLKENGWI